jgi:hypothetical protein
VITDEINTIKKQRMAKSKNNIWIWVVAAVVVLFLLGVINVPNLGNDAIDTDGTDIIQTYAADAAYATQLKFSTEAVGGTAYYAEADGIFQTSAPKLDRGTEYTFWTSNSTVYVLPKTFEAAGSNNIVNKVAYRTADADLSAWDTSNNCNVNELVTGTACNVTLGADSDAKLDIKYEGHAKTANLPFGGVMVVEYNSSIPTVSCAGDGIVGLNGKYQVTYSDSATTHTHKVYELASGFDVSPTGSVGTTKVVRCDFVNGGTAMAVGDTIKVSYLAANYYLGNDGMLYLDVEQKMNAANTRTGLDDQTVSFQVMA